jgi:hypothetical protein
MEIWNSGNREKKVTVHCGSAVGPALVAGPVGVRTTRHADERRPYSSERTVKRIGNFPVFLGFT